MRLLGFPVCSHLSPFLQSLPLQKSIKMTESQWPLQIPSCSRVLCTRASRHQLMLKHSQCTLGDWARSHASSFRSVIAVKIQSLQQSVMSCLSSHWSCSVLLGFSVCFFFLVELATQSLSISRAQSLSCNNCSYCLLNHFRYRSA